MSARTRPQSRSLARAQEDAGGPTESEPAPRGKAGGGLAGPIVALVALLSLVVLGWAVGFGPLRERAQVLLADEGEAEELPQIDRGPKPIDPAAASRAAPPEWVVARQKARAQLAEYERMIREAADDPERAKVLRELNAQLRQIIELEEEQRRLRETAAIGKAAGQANSARIDDLQRQIDSLKKAVEAGRARAHIPRSTPKDPDEVQVIRDARAAARADVGYLTLRTLNPPSAAVLDQGTELGSTPLARVPLEAGVHALKVVDGESRLRILSVKIEPGRVTELHAVDVGSLPAAP